MLLQSGLVLCVYSSGYIDFFSEWIEMRVMRPICLNYILICLLTLNPLT